MAKTKEVKTKTPAKKVVKKPAKVVKEVAKVEVQEAVGAPAVLPKYTDADRIWDLIRNRDLLVFGMPSQPTAKFCEKLPIGGDTLYLKTKFSSIIASLDQLLNVQNSGAVEKRVELFDISLTENGLVTITRKNPIK
jgi:hypothetical protein